jgi:amino acid adenylation domain-containing protein
VLNEQLKMDIFKGLELDSTLLAFEKSEIKTSVPARFERVVEQFADRIAIQTSEICWQYGLLNDRANQIAWSLLEKYGSESEPVTFLLGFPETQIAAMLGIQKAGKMYLPLERTLPKARLAAMFEDSQARTIITDNQNLALAREITRGDTIFINLDELDPRLSIVNPGIDITPDTPVYILYTSGSAGQPKGVIQNQRNLMHSIWGATRNYWIVPQDRFGLLTSTAFAASNGPIYGSILNGASIFHFDMQRGLSNLSRWIETEEITLLLMVPSLFRHLALSLTGDEKFSHLRLIVLMGETVTPSHIDLYRRHFPATCFLRNSYAATEMHTACSLTIDHQTEFNGSQIPVGKAVPDKEILLLDETGEEVESGEVGEIVIRSYYLSPGYWRRPDLNDVVFKSVTADGEKRLYFTGDLGWLNVEGNLVHLGRKDSMVKIRGYRIELGEIESILSQHPAVKECAVVVQESNVQEKRLVAFYVSKQNTTSIPAEELRIFVRRKLPDYMVPFAFVNVDALPYTPNGKLDRRSLPSLEEVLNLEKEYIPPRDEIERKLTNIWEELLEISPIGINNDFFQIGGHSLLAARMIARVEKEVGWRLDLGSISHATTIAELAKILRRGEGEGEPASLVPIRASGSRPPLFCVHGIGGHTLPFLDLANHLGREQPVYGLQAKTTRKGEKRTIPGMASEYVDELERFQPDGPYYLAGFSFGGFVAYEMARQLVNKGKKIALLALFDTQASALPRFRESLSQARYIHYRIRAFVEKTSFRISEVGLSSIFRNTNSKNQSADHNQIIMGDVDADTLPLHFREILEVNQSALRDYVPGRYSGMISLFKSSYYGRGVFYGWRELTSGRVRISEVPGTHRGMMQEPNVRILAEQLSRHITSSLGE